MTTPFARAAKAVDLLTVLHMSGPRKRPLGKARAADHRQSRGWGWRSNVVGIGVAQKAAGGKPGGTLAVTIYVRRKFAKSRLAKNGIVPAELRLRVLGFAVPTDVVELRGNLIGHAPTDQIRPLRPGIEVCHEFGDFGSLCAIVRWDQRPGRLFGLGCSHTLARCGIDVIPDSDLIEQPLAAVDLHQNSVGILTPKYSRIAFGGPSNAADFAIFEIDATTGAPTNRIMEQDRAIQTVDPRSAEELSQQVDTEIFGIRTQGAKGQTVSPHSSWKVALRKPDGTVASAVFTKVVAYETDCSEGDSGAPVLQQGTGNLLGMHFAGIQSSQFGLFVPAAGLFLDNGLALL